MTDKPDHIDVPVSGPAMVEVDAEKIAQIVFQTCHTSEARAARCANLILQYLAEVFEAAEGPQ